MLQVFFLSFYSFQHFFLLIPLINFLKILLIILNCSLNCEKFGWIVISVYLFGCLILIRKIRPKHKTILSNVIHRDVLGVGHVCDVVVQNSLVVNNLTIALSFLLILRLRVTFRVFLVLWVVICRKLLEIWQRKLVLRGVMVKLLFREVLRWNFLLIFLSLFLPFIVIEIIVIKMLLITFIFTSVFVLLTLLLNFRLRLSPERVRRLLDINLKNLILRRVSI